MTQPFSISLVVPKYRCLHKVFQDLLTLRYQHTSACIWLKCGSVLQSAWFVGLLWILQWESMFEILMVGTIFPVLLIPLGTIFGNVGEELLSWIGGAPTMALISGNLR